LALVAWQPRGRRRAAELQNSPDSPELVLAGTRQRQVRRARYAVSLRLGHRSSNGLELLHNAQTLCEVGVGNGGWGMGYGLWAMGHGEGAGQDPQDQRTQCPNVPMSLGIIQQARPPSGLAHHVVITFVWPTAGQHIPGHVEKEITSSKGMEGCAGDRSQRWSVTPSSPSRREVDFEFSPSPDRPRSKQSREKATSTHISVGHECYGNKCYGRTAMLPPGPTYTVVKVKRAFSASHEHDAEPCCCCSPRVDCCQQRFRFWQDVRGGLQALPSYTLEMFAPWVF
jgi:hypothetical protein